MKKKKLIIIPLIFALIASAVIFYYFGASYPVYNTTMNVEFAIPGLNDNFVPQGFCYDQTTDTYLISGYMADKTPSRIYRVRNGVSSEQDYITFKDGENFHKGHVGGITVYGDNVWIASGGKVYRVNKTTLLNAGNGESVLTIDKFDPQNNSSFITAKNGYLLVGEFYKNGDYETDQSHYLEIDQNTTNKALAFCFEIDESCEFGISSTTPIMALSLPNQVQGIDFTIDGKVITSSSYSIPDSHISIYDNVFTNENMTQMTVHGNTLPVYVLSKNNLSKDISAPAMSEEIVVKDGRIYILYESACCKYRLVNRTRTTNVQSILIEQ